MRSVPRPLAVLALGLGSVAALGACTANDKSGSDGDAGTTLQVSIAGGSCPVSADHTPSGKTTFSLVNSGSEVNEFEILAEDKLRIVAERENLGPGTTTDYTVVLKPGTYYTACKPRMVGNVTDLRQFTVTDSGAAVGPTGDEAEQQRKAAEEYTAYVKDQVGALLAGTKEFAAAYGSGDTAKAKELYPRVRMSYERVEPTAEEFGDIDPALDLREADAQSEGGKWTGWHVAEKDLWRPQGYAGLPEADRQKIAEGLVTDTQKLYDQVYAPGYTIGLDKITNGAIGLLEEVASTKVTGEEETFSHTDLYDIQANLEGAKVAFGAVRDIAAAKDPELVKEVDSRIAGVQAQLDRHRRGADGFESYDKVSEADRKQLSDAVNALRRPLATLTETVVG